MNFMERLEEGLGEDSTNITKHMRVSAYKKNQNAQDNPAESFLTEDDSSMANSTMISEAETERNSSEAQAQPRVPGYDHIQDSYFQHAATVDQPPVQAKPLNAHANTIFENFFGSNITVTKLLNKETNEEKIISKHA